MEVTSDNFEEVVKNIQQEIIDCDFVSFDLEFTGIFTSPNSKVTPFDTAEYRYSNLRESIENFIPIQFGLSLFKIVETDKVISRPYNFYLFKKPLRSNGIDSSTFLCQSASMEFLGKNDFDFNKWIKKGITFLSRSDEEKYRESLKEFEKRNNSKITPAPRDSSFIRDLHNQIKQWQDALPSTPTPTPTPTSTPTPTPMESSSNLDNDNQSTDYVLVSPANNYLKKLTYQIVKDEYPSLSATSVNDRGKYKIKIEKKKNDEGEDPEKKAQTDTENGILRQVGFRRIIDMVSRHSKVIVGHNCLLDMIHIYHRFIKPAPLSLVEFKKELHTVFPSIFDTKYVSSLESLKHLIIQNGLEDLHRRLQRYPFPVLENELPTGFERYSTDSSSSFSISSSTPSTPLKTSAPSIPSTPLTPSTPSTPSTTTTTPSTPSTPSNSNISRPHSTENEKLHEAGYDALITGLIFLKLIRYICNKQANDNNNKNNDNNNNININESEPPKEKMYDFNSELNKSMCNKLSQPGYKENLNFVDLSSDGQELNMKYENLVYFVDNLNPNVDIVTLKSHFNPYNKSVNPINIIWFDERSAFIAFDEHLNEEEHNRIQKHTKINIKKKDQQQQQSSIEVNITPLRQYHANQLESISILNTELSLASPYSSPFRKLERPSVGEKRKRSIFESDSKSSIIPLTTSPPSLSTTIISTVLSTTTSTTSTTSTPKYQPTIQEASHIKPNEEHHPAKRRKFQIVEPPTTSMLPPVSYYSQLPNSYSAPSPMETDFPGNSPPPSRVEYDFTSQNTEDSSKRSTTIQKEFPETCTIL
eukprot:TRINITY_DN2690_c0_g2_i1.p1 TRINITY_DN2690_c0_g2~~TRINITY_DN2690_c0_g2_i1.p1  ORF type:complete len:813 (+),score=186.60 TRINITY_DN2690_c0_g2_i1:13-2451(+)